MGLCIAVDRIDDLSLITDVIHDCWFDAEDVLFHESDSALEIRFTRRRPPDAGRGRSHQKTELAEVSCSLWIDHVESYEVRDSERVGRYDFNKLVYDPEKQEVAVLTGIPIEITTKVRRLGVRVQEREPVSSQKAASDE